MTLSLDSISPIEISYNQKESAHETSHAMSNSMPMQNALSVRDRKVAVDLIAFHVIITWTVLKKMGVATMILPLGLGKLKQKLGPRSDHIRRRKWKSYQQILKNLTSCFNKLHGCTVQRHIPANESSVTF